MTTTCAGIPVVAQRHTGGPLTMAEVDERLSEVGIDEDEADAAPNLHLPVSPPDKWRFGERTCPYVLAMIQAWSTDTPTARNPWFYNNCIRLECAHRLGCITKSDYERARRVLFARLAELVASTGERRTLKKFEREGAVTRAIERAAAKTDAEVRAELGSHSHEGDFWGNGSTTSVDEDAADDEPAGAVDDSDDGEVRHSGHLGMAIKLSKQFAAKLLYVHGVGWHSWDGKRWALDGNGAARRAVHRVIKRDRAIVKRLELSSEEEEKRLKAIARHETAGAISGILTEAAALQAFSVTVADLDADPFLFNHARGTLDLRTGESRPHSPADRLTKVARGAYRPDAESKLWDAFLAQVLPDAEVRGFLQRYAGVGLIGAVREHKLVIGTGTGANGKTVFDCAYRNALGDYAIAAEPDMLMQRDGAHPTGEMDLRGVRWVATSESDKNRQLGEAKVKRLTGGDTIRARKMRQDFVEFTPSHSLFLITNHLPKVSGDDAAIWRRIAVVPFDVTIPEAEQNADLGAQLELEADAIIAWAVAGYRQYVERGGLDEPASVRAATNAYQRSSDAVRRFIDDECVTTSPALKATTAQLYTGWERWRPTDGDAMGLSSRAFGMALDRHGYPADPPSNGKRWRPGIALKVAPDDGDDDD